MAKTYCISEDLHRTLADPRHRFRAYTQLGYVLTTGANWAKPIGKFTLTIEREPGQLVSLCWDNPCVNQPDGFRAEKPISTSKRLGYYLLRRFRTHLAQARILPYGVCKPRYEESTACDIFRQTNRIGQARLKNRNPAFRRPFHPSNPPPKRRARRKEQLMNPAAQRLAKLRQTMREHNLAAWIVPSADPHLSEYLPEHWQARVYFSGFTGSVGTLVVTADKAGLWADSRYWEQAAHQLQGSGIELQKVGEVAPYTDWLAAELPGRRGGGRGGRHAVADRQTPA